MSIDRRQFLKLAGLGGVVLVSGCAGARDPYSAAADEFFFVQLSDTHWGFQGAPNPDAQGTLPKAIAAVNALPVQPDFVVFTGDLTHTTDDPKERRRRLAQFKEIAGGLRAKSVRFMPGEHDGSLDRSAAYQEFFGPTHYTFDHKGVHFIALDNVSDPAGSIGDEQLAWLKQDLDRQERAARIVVLTHRPLFPLFPQWDWATGDGERALQLLMPYSNVTVFYGHIHQEHHFKTAHIEHHAAKSLIFPLPAPGSQPRRAPLAWDPAQPYRGLGFRQVEAEDKPVDYKIRELPVSGSARSEERVVRIASRKFAFDPDEVTLKAGEPVVLELTTDDVQMGFKSVDLGLRADILPGRVTRLRLTPQKAGAFPFFCDVFCGDDHELMSGVLRVVA
jgi:hypothetical protein